MPSADREHGTTARYSAGCRCSTCRAANADYHTHRRLERTRRAASGFMPEGIPHGRPSTYNNHGCRCDLCRQAWHDKRRVAPPRPPMQGTFPGFPEPSPEALELRDAKPDRKRTLRHQLTFDKGRHPATLAPLANNGETCGSCRNAWAHGEASRTYWKCALVPMTHGAGTDIRLKWPACTGWAALTDKAPERPRESKPRHAAGAHRPRGNF